MKNKKIFIIAEAGVNHNGSVKTARRMIDAAKEAGADAVKFQAFEAESLASKFAPKAAYQKKAMPKKETQLEMLRKLSLDRKAHRELFDHCRKVKITFLSTPYDLKSIDMLNDLGLKILKIPSGEITNLPYLKKIGSLRKKIIMSSGMAHMSDIKNALDIITARGTRKDDITVLHCSTEYPAPYEDVNLRAMLAIKDTFKIQVGYSDHTIGIEVAIAAAALGASVIEKHFTLDRKMEGPDHEASAEPHELNAMVRALRHVEKALGSYVKKPAASEMKNREAIRKSICASRDINKGELFTEFNITVKRPGTGISPMEWDRVIGLRAKTGFIKDEIIRQ